MVSDTRFAILGLLASEPGCGYDLTKRFGELFGADWRMSRGQVYGMLKTLEKDGLVESRRVVRNGRKIRLYNIKATGIEAFRVWREQPCCLTAPHREELFLKLALAQPEDLPRLLECLIDREQECVQRLHLHAKEPSPDAAAQGAWERRASGQIGSAITAMLQAELDWVEAMKRCIEEHLGSLAGAGGAPAHTAVGQVRRVA